MALKEYLWRGNTWQFEESDAPSDAVPVEAEAKRARAASSKKAATPKDKAKPPAKNKKRRTPTSKKAGA